MDQIIPGLWIGDLPSALNVQMLKEHGIFSILSAMRGRITIHETFIRHQIKLDDTEDADILSHFLPSIHFIQAELDRGRGVLVHCQAGISRSSTIVAAYLMYSLKIDPKAAIALIREARPFVDPNQGFLQQLELFHQTQFNISRDEKAVRMFYLDRAVEDVMNGGGPPDTEMFARHSRSSSIPNTPTPGRRIRCKMCRQELATREHMLDHGQLGTAAPASNTPTTPSVHPMDPLHSTSQHLLDQTTVYTSNTIDDEWHLIPHAPSTSSPPMKPDLAGTTAEDIAIDASQLLGRGLSDAVVTGVNDEKPAGQDEDPNTPRETMAEPQTAHITSSAELTPQLLANPKLAASQSPAARGLQQNVPPHTLSKQSPAFPSSPPILINPKCSGYFVEPMKWMDHFLSSGQLGGKITCPNKKCGTKLGNYDWAGMCCGCSHWVTPAFCINRSKVDEIG